MYRWSLRIELRSRGVVTMLAKVFALNGLAWCTEIQITMSLALVINGVASMLARPTRCSDWMANHVSGSAWDLFLMFFQMQSSHVLQHKACMNQAGEETMQLIVCSRWLAHQSSNVNGYLPHQLFPVSHNFAKPSFLAAGSESALLGLTKRYGSYWHEC